MPYVSQEIRNKWASFFEYRLDIESQGELNYLITRLILEYKDQHGTSYKTLNDIVGALNSATAEFERRVVAPYEDAKIKENGDVYDVT